ncbi:hypothetical protein HKO46_02250 [Streptococcus equi subsp. zooepidemicus]|uniref:hypothetical protein n=1 Tax=Streptococcus equi TaxID=1336 RepID=UPI00021745E3|nr:hypothetical protein [Streptococcus equi]AEJ24344.1 membrane protein [Streptococcus equi subsp. zooepidemicus ATCC 35246]AIA68235.1 membrane protein [Streptococcus equi subsp. zooepidemicus CY]MBR7683657.1 hypothetical protein [Streptococcus equi subsp. zooepidemicus]MBR7752581.1 hypothetical protein [Streptococcus equi subsp. zooepidemicus]MBR7775223.1 hypothetical protein [Streptococcus equi subsp. zooepidemicus]
MKKVKQLIIAMIASLLLIANTAPSIVYASEVTKISQKHQAVNEAINEIDIILDNPIYVSESELNSRIQEAKVRYPNLSEERMKELAYQTLSPYSFRASVWDGQGVTLDEFAWAFDVIVGGLISGYATIGKYVAKHGVAAARAVLSRAAKAAAQRVGVLTGFISGLLGAAFSVINIYYNVGYALAQYVDARDYHPNNGRINAWA